MAGYPSRARYRSRRGPRKCWNCPCGRHWPLGHHYIGTEHVLLALLREGQGVAAQVLTRPAPTTARSGNRSWARAGDSDQNDLQTRLAADLVDTAEQLDRVRREKEAAFDAADLEAAAALRNQESQLLAGKLRLERQLTANSGEQALIAEIHRLHRELEHLRDLLRQNELRRRRRQNRLTSDQAQVTAHTGWHRSRRQGRRSRTGQEWQELEQAGWGLSEAEGCRWAR